VLGRLVADVGRVLADCLLKAASNNTQFKK
jgi:hypothetical protein